MHPMGKIDCQFADHVHRKGTIDSNHFLIRTALIFSAFLKQRRPFFDGKTDDSRVEMCTQAGRLLDDRVCIRNLRNITDTLPNLQYPVAFLIDMNSSQHLRYLPPPGKLFGNRTI